LENLIELAKKQSNMKDENIKVSVVIPNYNYEKFMYQRLYSVLSQNYKLHEIIILDDCSIDNSKELIDEIVYKLEKYINIRKIYNKTNSGTAFKQWKKGFENVTGDYVWIAEADDYCKETLISNLIKPILKNENILISYADTAFIDIEGKIIMKTIKPEIDIRKTGHWNKSFINNGKNEIENYTFLNCTIANVSSCIIKKDDYEQYLTESCDYKQAGDWIFYANVMKNGYISYTNKVLNYYRVHGNNVSSTMNHKNHIDEINKIHSKFIKEFKLGKFQKNEMSKRIQFLKDCWKVK
jgi:glycosyltransferase involved in cell wall biosynthesis